MADSTEAGSVLQFDAETYPLGASRPPLGVDDLPEPEEVFKVRRLGPIQIIQSWRCFFPGSLAHSTCHFRRYS